ncbi:MAG: selenocysteine-specific translation elongation factor [Planctomycetes bacterium]|nr:selenocysteine-specific translation elongation factor [Planctomycetota bacterium]
MKHLVAGTAGHIDHGKTALVKALTGIDTDRLPEEKRRGISIELGYAYLDLPDGTRIGLVDVPGHERFVRTMVAGATGIDFAILVVAADDSVMPQTREHLAILSLLGVRDGLIALNKIDLVDPDMAELVAEEIRELVAGTFLADARVVPVSSITGAGLDELKGVIAEVAARVPERGGGALARVPIDRSFALPGHGTIVTGTMTSGSLRVGDEVDILPRGLRARIRSLQWHGTPAEAVFAGQRAALNLSGIKHDELARGDVACARGGFVPTSMVDGLVTLDRSQTMPVKHGMSVSFHLGTSEVTGRLVLLDRLRLEAGEQGWAQLRLAGQVVARRGDRFILRTVGGEATLGGGQVLDAHPLKHRRQRVEAALALEAIGQGGLSAAIAHELHKANAPLRLSTLCPELGESRFEVEAAIGPSRQEAGGRRQGAVGSQQSAIRNQQSAIRLVPTGADAWLYDRELADAIAGRVLEALAAHHKEKPLLPTGLTLTALSAKVDPQRLFSEEVLAAILEELVVAGKARRVDGTYALASHRVELDPRQAAIRQAILDACLARPFMPPTLQDLQGALPFPAAQIAQVFESLLKAGELIDGEVCGFHPKAVEDAWCQFEGFLRQHGQATVSEFRQLLGTTRRYAMGLMQHFDATGRVVRDGDFRRIP